MHKQSFAHARFCFVVVYTVQQRLSFLIVRMNTVTIFFNTQGSHLLISGKYSGGKK